MCEKTCNASVCYLARTPLNEDVFAAPSKVDLTVTHEEIKDLQAKIYKLFLQVIIKWVYMWCYACTYLSS